MKIIQAGARVRKEMDAPLSTGENVQPSQIFPFLRLPLELRRQIYRQALWNSRVPSAEDLYLRRLPDDWKSSPSPLLQVSRQVRAETIDWVQNYPISLLVTHQGIHFDATAETCFIAQKCSRDYGKIRHLVIDISPPHPDRPTDAIDIWRQLRKLRKELRDLPLLRQVSFFFADNDMAAWVKNGRATSFLDKPYADPSTLDWGENDVVDIMLLFQRVRATKAAWHLPRGLKSGEPKEHILDWLEDTNDMMMGLLPSDDAIHDEEDYLQSRLQDDIDEDQEFKLQRFGAKIARDKLDDMTSFGKNRMNRKEWEDFIFLWSPHLELLIPREFKGVEHYVNLDDQGDLMLVEYLMRYCNLSFNPLRY